MRRQFCSIFLSAAARLPSAQGSFLLHSRQTAHSNACLLTQLDVFFETFSPATRRADLFLSLQTPSIAGDWRGERESSQEDFLARGFATNVLALLQFQREKGMCRRRAHLHNK